MSAVRPPQMQDDFKRMSFGDHLDELRTRLVRALLAVLVCVGAMVPFKGTITEVYIQPYRQMWQWQYDSYFSGLDAKIASIESELTAASEPQDRERIETKVAPLREAREWNRQNYSLVRAG